MTSTLLNLSEKIDSRIVDVYRIIDQLSSQLRIPYIVIGAAARDLVLHYGYGADIERATEDIDFGLCVSSWDAFQQLRLSLMENDFQQTPIQHRLTSANNICIDIIPFGNIETGNKHIAWPPDGKIVMSVLGFDEALNSAEMVCIQKKPMMQIPVVTPPGMSLLKLAAWTDRAESVRKKDAKDFLYLLKSYEKIPSIRETVYEIPRLMESYEWNLTLASTYCLGMHARKISSTEMISRVNNIFIGGYNGLNAQKLAEESSDRFEAPNAHLHHQVIEAYFAGYGH